MILRKGGKIVTFVTYGLFGGNRIRHVPLLHVSAVKSSGTSASYPPIKVKGKRIYFVLDKKGEYTNKPVFDHVINVRRQF